jgi:hypothetical protein
MRILIRFTLQFFDSLLVGIDPFLRIDKQLFEQLDILPDRLRCHLPIELRELSFKCHEKHHSISKNKNLVIFLIISNSYEVIEFPFYFNWLYHDHFAAIPRERVQIITVYEIMLFTDTCEYAIEYQVQRLPPVLKMIHGSTTSPEVPAD